MVSVAVESEVSARTSGDVSVLEPLLLFTVAELLSFVELLLLGKLTVGAPLC